MSSVLRLAQLAVRAASLVAILAGGGVAVAFSMAALAPRISEFISANESSSAEIDLGELRTRSIVYDAYGNEFDVLYDVENREYAALDEIADELIQAVIAVEDKGFWDHHGVDAEAIGRALLQNVEAGGIEQGGSTITQQLIKNVVVGSDLNLERKIPEAAMAMRLEDQLSKEEILEAYLNTVYFGAGAYGARAAAEVYFGVDVGELDWAQSALLAGLIANPTAAEPTRHPERAAQRRAIVLASLLEQGKIRQWQHDAYADTPLPAERHVPAEWEPSNYFIEEVRRRLLDDPRLGETVEERAEALFANGLRVYTTYDPIAQAQAEAAVAEYLPDDDRNFVIALAAVEPGSGQVRALIGGPGFDSFEFNIATQKGRPTGSAFKTFVLAAAMEKGIRPYDIINGVGRCDFDNPGGFPNPYRVNNFGGSRGSVGTIRSQTLRSSNCAFVRLGLVVGLSNVASTAAAMGITTDLSDLPLSMPLGPKDVTPLDMASAYATVANDGLAVDPIFITRVEDSQGNVLLENMPDPERAISEHSARLVTSLLKANVRGGTGTRARLPDQEAAGKTGTAQDFYDAWFVGFTPYLSTAVWIGNPDEQVEMRNVSGIPRVTGGSIPARVWGHFNTAYHADREPIPFADPGWPGGGNFLRTDQEEKDLKELEESYCGPDDEAAAVDIDEDGEADYCDPELSEYEFDRGLAGCPKLYEPVWNDRETIITDCTPPTTTTTTLPPCDLIVAAEPCDPTSTLPGDPAGSVPGDPATTLPGGPTSSVVGPAATTPPATTPPPTTPPPTTQPATTLAATTTTPPGATATTGAGSAASSSVP